MDTLINLIIAVALQFTGAHVAKQNLIMNHQEITTSIKKCSENHLCLTTKNEQFCKENITQ